MNSNQPEKYQKEVLKIDNCVKLNLYPKPPFHFDATVYKPSHFPSSDNYYEKGKFWFTTYFLNQPLGIKMAKYGSTDRPIVKTSVYSQQPLEDKDLEKIINEIKWRFDMDLDLNRFYDSVKNDLLLQPILKRWRGMRVKACQSLYEFLVITIVLQNAPVRRSVQMMENLFKAYGYRVQFDNKILSCFWDPESLAQVNEDEMRALKLGYRAKFLSRISKDFADKKVDEMAMRSLPKDLLRKKLLQLYGIGPASVWYIIFEIFHHYDALETISPWEQKIYSKLLFDKELVPKEEIMKEVAQRWSEWRMLAIHYIFEDIFWKRKTEKVEWLEELIRL